MHAVAQCHAHLSRVPQGAASRQADAAEAVERREREAELEVSKEWIEQVQEVEDECSAIAVGYLIKETIEVMILQQCSMGEDYSAPRKREVTMMFTSCGLSFLLQIGIGRWLSNSPRGDLSFCPLRRRSVEFLHGLLTAAGGWMLLCGIRMLCSRVIPQHACQYAAASMFMALACGLLLLVFHHLEQKNIVFARTSEDLISCVGMATGFAWERAWGGAIHSVVHDGLVKEFGHFELLLETLLCLATSALMLPGWRLYILPPALAAAAADEDSQEVSGETQETGQDTAVTSTRLRRISSETQDSGQWW